jgi:hypothetical protein
LALKEEVPPMTWFLRQAFLVLVAFATLALIVMMAMTVEAKTLRSDGAVASVADEFGRLAALDR